MPSKFWFLLFFVLIASTAFISADENEGEEGEFGEDLSENLGTVAVGFLFLGAGYVLLRRAFVFSRLLNTKKYGQLQDHLLVLYKNLRKPMLRLHNVVLVMATLVAGLHGILLLDESLASLITGTIAWAAMVLLSISGAIIYYRFRPVWTNRTSKGFVRFLHRQWILTGLMIIGLIAHVGID